MGHNWRPGPQATLPQRWSGVLAAAPEGVVETEEELLDGSPNWRRKKTRKDSDSDTSEKALEDLQIWESQEEQLPEDRGLGLAPPTTSGIGQSSPVIRPSSCRE